VTFSGTAYSVDLSGTANHIAFDNVTSVSSVPSPEPGTPVMFASGTLGLAGLLRRKFLA
jgi:hypothetical protein